MVDEIIIPNVGANIDEGEIAEWLVAEGDVVVAFDILFVYETTKAAIEVESERDGVILKIIHHNGVHKPLTVVGYIGDPGDQAPQG